LCLISALICAATPSTTIAQQPGAGYAQPPMFPFALPGVPSAPAARPPSAMDPFTQWMVASMAPMLAMANPQLYGQWMGVMTNPFVDQATKHGILDAMMRSFDPRFMVGGPAASKDGKVPEQVPVVRIPGFPTQTLQPHRPNTVTDEVSDEAKRKFYQTMMMMSPLSMRDMIGVMARKRLVDVGVSFEDAIDSMKLRANEVNFKLVGHSPLWLDVRAITGDQNTPRVEIFQFCDAIVARKILDHVPEFVVFLPCRIALIEDADGRIWVMTLDWDVSWLDYAQNPNSQLDLELRQDARRIRDAIAYIMEGAATGDF
jgi:uncharacterized protein (DUF302 family)